MTSPEMHEFLRAELERIHGREARSDERKKRTGGSSWIAACITSDSGKPLPILSNALIGLRADPSLKDSVAFDEMLRAPLLMRSLEKDAAFKPRPVTDEDVSAIQEYLQHAGLSRLGKDVVHQAIDLRAVERAFHPVRNYLNALTWDGKSRLNTWLCTYLGAEDNEYSGDRRHRCSSSPGGAHL